MRFILFNIAVGTALVYLFNTGSLPLGELRSSIDQTTAKVATWTNAQISQPKQAAPSPVEAAATGDKIISKSREDFKEEILKSVPESSAKKVVEMLPV